MKIYLASSWRNEQQPALVEALRAAGHSVYDFRNPGDGSPGFHWSEIDSEWRSWSPNRFRSALHHPIAQAGFQKDLSALDDCDVCVLLLPCGRSAHLEAGYAKGAGKEVIALLAQGEPELMYKLCDGLATSTEELLAILAP